MTTDKELNEVVDSRFIVGKWTIMKAPKIHNNIRLPYGPFDTEEKAIEFYENNSYE